MHEATRQWDTVSMSLLSNLLRDTKGATAVEYGLLVGLIALTAATGMTSFANEVNREWTMISTTIGPILGNPSA